MPSKRKSRKRRTPSAARAARPAAASSPPRGYARSRARDDQARAALEPLAPGERPLAVTVGAIAAALLAGANVVSAAIAAHGRELTGRLAGAALLLLIAYGMWRARYWAVLGMQTLLALAIIGASLVLLFAPTVWAALLVLLILAPCGTLFWFLVKAMARIQMPERPGSQRTG